MFYLHVIRLCVVQYISDPRAGGEGGHPRIAHLTTDTVEFMSQHIEIFFHIEIFLYVAVLWFLLSSKHA